MLGRIGTLLGAGALAFTSLVAIGSTPAGAAVITVSSTADDGSVGTLREAIETQAVTAGGDTVVLQAGATYLLDDCKAGQLSHGGTPLTIEGNGATIEQTCPGERVLEQGAAAINLQDVTITGGDSDGAGGGVFTSGDVTVLRSTFADNHTTTTSGGGGLYVNDADARITASTFVSNTGRQGGGVDAEQELVIVNSTFTDNHTDNGELGDGVGGGIYADVDLTLVYSTVVGNDVGGTGFGHNVYVGSDSTATLFGNVIANGTCYLGNLNTTVTNEGYNVGDASSATSCELTEPTDRTVADVMLGGLAANGGATETMLPATGSPLIDGIPDAACQTGAAAGVLDDQRGLARPSPSGGACDVGAVEVQVAIPDPPTGPPEIEPTFTG